MSRDPLVVAGGNAILFAASVILDLRKRSIQETDPISKEEGVKIGVSIKKNHCVPNKNPYVKTEYFAIFNQGIEQYLSTLDHAVKQGVLVKGGAWIKDIDPATGESKEVNGVKYAWQGKEAFRNFCKENPEYFAGIQSRAKGVVQMSSDEIKEIEAEEAEITGSLPDDIINQAEEGISKKSRKKS